MLTFISTHRCKPFFARRQIILKHNIWVHLKSPITSWHCWTEEGGNFDDTTINYLLLLIHGGLAFSKSCPGMCLEINRIPREWHFKAVAFGAEHFEGCQVTRSYKSAKFLGICLFCHLLRFLRLFSEKPLSMRDLAVQIISERPNIKRGSEQMLYLTVQCIRPNFYNYSNDSARLVRKDFFP